MRDTIEMLLVDRDEQYAKAMARALAEFDRNLSITRLRENRFREMLSESGASEFSKYHVILNGCTDISGDIISNKTVEEMVNRMLFLADDEAEMDSDYFCKLCDMAQVMKDNESNGAEKRMPFIGKYTPADILSSEIRQFHNMRYGSTSVGMKEQGTRLITVCSPSGGAGATSVALTIAGILSSSRRMNVCYLNYEDFPSTEAYFSTDERSEGRKYDITAYMYFLLEKREPQSFINMFSVKDKNNVSTFRPASGRNRLKILQLDEFIEFIVSISEGDQFDYIIADIGSDTLANANFLLRISDKILLVGSDGDKHYVKKRLWLNEFLEEYMHADEAEKLIVADNMTDEAGIRCIRRDDASFIKRNKHIEISLTGRFAEDVERVLEEVM